MAHRTLIPFMLLAVSMMSGQNARAEDPTGDIVVGRYARATAGLSSDLSQEMANPMRTVVSLTFPKETVATVGDAAQYLLTRSGYDLNADVGGEHHVRLMGFPLPESQRRLDYLTVEQALAMLGGQSYAPEIDHVHRTVAFGLKISVDAHLGAQIAGAASDVTTLAKREE